MRLEHPIFRSPLAADISTHEIATPEQYVSWRDGRELSETMIAWTVQKGSLGSETDIGLVSDCYGFEDSPDAEWISSGVNSKGPGFLALCRQGNRFLWGFAGDPTLMTDSAQQVFLNTLVYMTRFDGQKPLVSKQNRSREWMQVYVGSVAKLKAGKGQEFVEREFSASVRKKHGLDEEKLRAYYVTNEEYLHCEPESRGMRVDEELRSLGISNRKPAFLSLLRMRLHANAEDALALGLADRYLSPEAPRGDAAAIVEWLNSHEVGVPTGGQGS